MHNVWWVCIAVLGAGCATMPSWEARHTIAIPYVQGDDQGLLTSALIAEVQSTGLYRYVSEGGDLELRASIVQHNDQVVGYRYDRSPNRGKIEKNLLASENRAQVTVEVTLCEGSHRDPVMGPVMISASADFDYVDVNTLREVAVVGPRGKLQKMIDFSQGQLDSIEGAQEGARRPVYRRLAQRVARALQQHALKREQAGAS